MGLLMIIFWVALLIAVVVVLVRLSESARHGEGEDLLKELRDRYARDDENPDEDEKQGSDSSG